jgi:hypothetical protein
MPQSFAPPFFWSFLSKNDGLEGGDLNDDEKANDDGASAKKNGIGRRIFGELACLKLGLFKDDAVFAH